MDKFLIVVAGPTAVGKTQLALDLARKYRTVIVSADSRQVYRELGIGTAKPTLEELQEIPHHFINHVSIHDRFTAADFEREATELLNHLFHTHRVVILCGGTGLYIRALLQGLDQIPEIPEAIRRGVRDLYATAGLEAVRKELQKVDPEYFQKIDHQNPHRVMRALEVKLATHKSLGDFHGKSTKVLPFIPIQLGLELPRMELYARINQRMQAMISGGLFEEARELWPYEALPALKTVGYQEIFEYLHGRATYAQTVELLQQNSRRYAKRQLTWFRADPSLRWFSAGDIQGINAYLATFEL